MGLFKRKKNKDLPNAKFKITQMVRFRYRDELTFGFIYNVKEADDGTILYDVQVAGQCPWFVYNLKEDDLHIYDL